MQRLFLLVMSSVFVAAGAYAGTVKGTVTFEGEAPPMRPLDVSGDPHCKAMRGEDPPVNEALALGPGQRMANVIVWISKGVPQKDYPAPETPQVLTQRGCQYVPHVLVVQKGQTLEVKNPDGILHNVNGMAKANPPFNLAMPATLEETIVKLDTTEAEPFEIRCDVHPWMRAWCAVLDHPYFQVTGQDGTYEIKDLPPGDYELSAWHEKLGVQTVQVQVPEAPAAEQSFTFTRP
ncbi:MAG: TonB-dependent receptor [Candidatus Hydrogenedentes bacterium]|nr:TonB-dependent receptor [Candidatus Hydrogenedentota bacterium]